MFAIDRSGPSAITRPIAGRSAQSRHPDITQPEVQQWLADNARLLAAHPALDEPGLYACSHVQLDRAWYGQIQADARALIALARRVSREHAPTREGQREDFRPLVQRAMQHPQGQTPLPPLARPDGLLVRGQWMALELNIDSGLGWYFEVEHIQRRLQALLRAQGQAQEAQAVPTVLPELCAYLADIAARRGDGPCHVGLMLDDHLNAYDRHQAQWLADTLHQLQPRLRSRLQPRLCASRSLQRRGHRMHDEHGPLDLVWRFASMLHPHEAIAPAIEVQMQALHTDTWLISNPADLGVECKLALACLSEWSQDESAPLSPHERALVRRRVPWSRRLGGLPSAPSHALDCSAHCLPAQELLAMARLRQVDLVLKRSQSRASQHVHVGCQLTAQAWQARLTEAACDPIPWVLQQHLQADRLSFSHVAPGDSPDRVDMGVHEWGLSPFIVGQSMAAPFLRVAPQAADDPQARSAATQAGLAACLLG